MTTGTEKQEEKWNIDTEVGRRADLFYSKSKFQVR